MLLNKGKTESKYICREEAELLMNRWGRERTPYIFLIDYLGEKCRVEKLDEVDPDSLKYDFNGVTNVERLSEGMRKPFQWEVHPMPFSEYQKAFEPVFAHLHAGNSFLTNLTAPTPIVTNYSLLDIFHASNAPYRLWVDGEFVVFSPEIFVQIKDGKIHSFPMKGTIDASLPHAADILRNDPKERAEHATITDLIRNDLSMVAERVTVRRYAYLDRIVTHRGELLQMSSEIEGILPSDYRSNLGSLFLKLLPAGSITGAPKKKTMQIIREAENYNRGFYTGVAGIFDGENLDSAVLIRFIEEDEAGNKVYKSGGGITFQSEAQKEYEELIQKVYVPFYRNPAS